MRAFVRAFAMAAVAAMAAPWSAVAQAPAAAAPAQEAKGAKRDKGIPEHFDGIALTDDQKTKIRELHHLYHTQMTQLKVTTKKKNDEGQTVPMTPKVKKQLDDLEAKEMGEYRTLLNAEQQVIFDKNVAKEKAEAARKAEDAKKAANP